MKKIIGIVILGIVILFLVSRGYYFIVMNNVYRAIEEFRREENRYYSVVKSNYNRSSIKEEILVKDTIQKYIKLSDETNYCQWKNFDNAQKYFIDLQNKSFIGDILLEEEQSFLINLPELISNIYDNNKFNINQFLKIKYIIPMKYENEECYKIVTNFETIIVNRNTYLPIYSSLKFINSNEDSKGLVENRYEFKVGEVTDEDVALPDLTGYTNLGEK